MGQTRRDFLISLGLGSAAILSSPTEVFATKPKSSAPQLELAEYINIADLYHQTAPTIIPDPTDSQSIGGKDVPIHLYWNDNIPTRTDGQPLCGEDIIVDNQKGQLRIRENDNEERVLLQWTIPKTRSEPEINNPKDHWLRDETGPHILIGKFDGNIPPENIHYAPASIPALRNHALHYRNIYLRSEDAAKYPSKTIDDRGTQVGNIEDLEKILPIPKDGRYHEIAPPLHIHKNSAEWILWCDDTAHKMAYNLIHFNPHMKGYKKEHNLSLLALAMTESAGGEVGDKLGPNPFLVNYAGYGGLFQFYIGNNPKKREALEEAGFVTPSGNWKENLVHGKIVHNAESFKYDWKAQCYAQLQWMKKLQQYIEPTYRMYQNTAHVQKHPHSLFGYCAAAHLTGPNGAKALLKSGKVSRDGTGTPNSYYAYKFSAVPDTCFFSGEVKIPRTLSDINMDYKYENEVDIKRESHQEKRIELLNRENVMLPDKTRVAPKSVRIPIPVGRSH